MANFSVQAVKKPDFDGLTKNARFAVASALTQTAKDGQAAIVESLKTTFTIRNNWTNQNTPVGIKIRPATKQNLESEIRAGASFLKPHESGADKLPYNRKYLAVPTENVRRNKRDIVPRSQRPKALKNSFIVAGKSNQKLIFVRKGKGKRAKSVLMYVLIPRAKIKKESTFFEPARETTAKNLVPNFKKAWETAQKTAK